MVKLDKINVSILELLQKNSSLSIQTIADRMDISYKKACSRISLLQEGGYIKGYVAILDKKKLGLIVTAYVKIKIVKQVSQMERKSIEQQLCTFDEISDIMAVSGSFDYLIKLTVASLHDFQNFMANKLSHLATSIRFESNIALSEIKTESILPIAKPL